MSRQLVAWTNSSLQLTIHLPCVHNSCHLFPCSVFHNLTMVAAVYVMHWFHHFMLSSTSEVLLHLINWIMLWFNKSDSLYMLLRWSMYKHDLEDKPHLIVYQCTQNSIKLIMNAVCNGYSDEQGSNYMKHFAGRFEIPSSVSQLPCKIVWLVLDVLFNVVLTCLGLWSQTHYIIRHSSWAQQTLQRFENCLSQPNSWRMFQFVDKGNARNFLYRYETKLLLQLDSCWCSAILLTLICLCLSIMSFSAHSYDLWEVRWMSVVHRISMYFLSFSIGCQIAI
jgi:hypothetical protein